MTSTIPRRGLGLGLRLASLPTTITDSVRRNNGGGAKLRGWEIAANAGPVVTLTLYRSL